MSIKIILLKSGETLISDAKELISDDKVCGYLLEEPHIVEIIDTSSGTFILSEQKEISNDSLHISLFPWLVLSKNRKIPIPPDWVVTVVDPIDEVKQMYEDKLNGKDNQVPIN